MWWLNRRNMLLSSGALLSLGGAFATGLSLRAIRPLPRIVATLEGDESQFTLGLTARLRERFPVGSSENELIDFLDTEGFSSEWRRPNADKSGVFVREGALCRKVVHVRWKASEKGVVSVVDGEFSSKCI